MIHRNNSRRFLLPVLLLALSVIGNFALPAGAQAASHPKKISIAQARSLPLGTIVTVDGSLTVPSGAFSSSTFDQGFAIQDHTGGIYVSVADNLGFAPRLQVRVTGRLADSFGLLVLIPSDNDDIKPHGHGPKVEPLPVATGAIGEATEGKLVRVTGTITQPVENDLPFGFKVVVNDGSGEIQIFVNASTGINVSGLHAGQTIKVTGFSGQFADHFEVDPRFQSDIQIVH
ncbi:MAG: OB-fold nucleic acid binding domain-containing protein [Blastocatellia bacterium]